MFGEYVTEDLKIPIMVHSQRKKKTQHLDIKSCDQNLQWDSFIHIPGLQSLQQDTTQTPVNRGRTNPRAAENCYSEL